MKISRNQILWLLATIEFGSTVLLAFTTSFERAKQDVWMSMILAGGVALFITFMAVKISLHFPTKTFVEYSEILFGKWLGKILVIPYFLMLLSAIPAITREGTDFITTTILQETPIWVIVTVLSAISFYAAYGGIEGIARSCEFLGPIIYFLLLVLIIVLTKDLDWHQLLPVYVDSGIKNIALGSISLCSFLGESILLILIFPFINEQKNIFRYPLFGVFIASFFLIIFILVVLTLFGYDLAGKMWYPAYAAVRTVTIGNFLERIDPIGIIIWLYSVITKLALFMFIAAYSLSQWLNIKKWRNLLWFVLAVQIFGAMIPRDILSTDIEYVSKFWIRYVFPIDMLGLPMLVWGMAVVREKRQKKKTD